MRWNSHFESGTLALVIAFHDLADFVQAGNNVGGLMRTDISINSRIGRNWLPNSAIKEEMPSP